MKSTLALILSLLALGQTIISNNASDMTNHIVMVADSSTPRTVTNAFTYTGLQTFDRDPSAPFAVTASSAKVTNLDADKLDGLDDTAFFKLNSANAGNLIFTDATYDIGASGATRPRDLFLSRNATLGGSVDISAAAAGQIVFPATQNASSGVNTLDDYEEGSWTPVLGGSGGTSGQTYTRQIGSYIKVGRLVTAQFTILLSAKGTITTDVQVQGLPFTVENTANYFGSVHITYWDTLAVAKVYMGGLCNANTTTATIYGLAAAGVSFAVFATADIANTTQIIGTITYRATA